LGSDESVREEEDEEEEEEEEEEVGEEEEEGFETLPEPPKPRIR
jgi:hypothetical protein